MQEKAIPAGSSEMFALCVNDAREELDGGAPFVQAGRLYAVVGFVQKRGYFPYGVRLADAHDRVLPHTFFLQRFTYFEHHLN